MNFVSGRARPSRADIAACLAAHPPRLTPGVAEVVAKLHERGVAVCLVSGGFRLMIEPVADRLGISRERIWANSLESTQRAASSGTTTASRRRAAAASPRWWPSSSARRTRTCAS